MLSQKQLFTYVKKEPQQSSSTLLNLSHKQLRKIPQVSLNALATTNIDLSYNFLKSLALIKIQQNQLSSQQNLERQNYYLKWLDISFNIIEDIDLKKQPFADNFRYLEYLNVCANRIKTVNLSDKPYSNLKYLHLKNNRIKFFTHCPFTIKVLTLDKNDLSEIAFTGGDSLEILSASHNKIQKIAIKTQQLVFLDLQDNQILNIDLFYQFLEHTKKLLSVNMLENPINLNKDYRILVLSTCPKIVQIDEIYINPHVREGFRILKEQKKLEEVLQRTTQNYQKRLQAQLKYKEMMLEKLKLQQKEIQEKFQSYCQVEKQQMEILQQHAKNTLGLTRFKIADQKDQFIQKVHNIQPELREKNSNKKESILGQLNENKKLNIDLQQYQHRRSYQNYRKNITKGKKDEFQFSQDKNHMTNSQLSNENPSRLKVKNQILKPSNKDYRNSRISILNIGIIEALKFQGKEMIIDPQSQKSSSYKSLSQSNIYSNPQIQFPKQMIQLKIEQVIDFRCLKFLDKHYNFYG